MHNGVKLFLFTLALGAACKSSDDDTSTPVITITSPVENQVYTSGNVVQIKGTLSDNHLHEARVTITANSGGTVLYGSPISIHGATSYTLNESWTSVVAAVTDATVKVEAADLAGNHAEKKIAIRINP